MTKRSEMAPRKAEAQAKLMNSVANKALSKKTSGLDGLAKTVVAKKAGAVSVDDDLDHSQHD